MLIGEVKSKVDALWESFWSGAISKPLAVLQQITYLIFLKQLDGLQVIGWDFFD